MGAPVAETAAPYRTSATISTMNTTSTARFTHRYTDVRYEGDNDEYAQEPPPRSLADYFPAEPQPHTTGSDNTAVTATCPICDAFEGDEVAISHHVEREH
jgi:hypothetical protein